MKNLFDNKNFFKWVKEAGTDHYVSLCGNYRAIYRKTISNNKIYIIALYNPTQTLINVQNLDGKISVKEYFLNEKDYP